MFADLVGDKLDRTWTPTAYSHKSSTNYRLHDVSIHRVEFLIGAHVRNTLFN